MVVEHCGRPLPAHAGTSLDFHANLFELGKGQQHVQGQAAHGCRRIELLGHGDERDAMGVEQLDQLNEIRQRAGQPVDFVDNDDIDLAVPDVGQKPLQGRALGRAAGNR
jgi:hypothetical protein